MMNLKLRKNFLADVESAVVNAECKHPKICDEFCTKEKEEIQQLTKLYRFVNDQKEERNESEWYGVIKEEIYEALEAFAGKDYRNCLKELAQVAAVAVRGMEFVYRLTEEAKASEKFKGGKND